MKSFLEELAGTLAEKKEKRKCPQTLKSGYDAGWIDCLLFIADHHNNKNSKYEREFLIRGANGEVVHCGVLANVAVVAKKGKK